ncbi:glycosyltransferase [Streptomyces sp. CoH27]|uniref:glycosyltransferase n=1 Tax=Streptomyces sp. CoH27 TaxID=2875763 RepID=UPI001CD46B6A|nr:glycosyltransferase [Streptomyces sp. CoH27]
MTNQEVRIMRVGMVVPTLGERPELLKECLNSLTGQAYSGLRLVVVSPPGALTAGEQAMSPRITVLPQSGSGIVDAVMTGWRYFGDGVDVMGWLGDDDRLPPGSITQALHALERQTGAAMAYGQVRYIDGAGRPFKTMRPGRVGSLLLRLGYNMVYQPGCLYRRTAVEAIGGLDDSFRLAFDVDFHRRLAAYGGLRYVASVLGEIRDHPDSLTVRRLSESQREAELALSRQMPDWLRRTRPVWRPATDVLHRAVAKAAGR